MRANAARMARYLYASILGATVLAGAAVMAAPRPSAFAQAAPGMWEISGYPGSKAPARECVGNLALLAQYEHRRLNCSSSVVSDHAPSSVVQYTCPGGGFGRSTITMITPRSLRIETQGISDNLPFNYTLQARRVGDCPSQSAASAR
jgi:hypothetical protein